MSGVDSLEVHAHGSCSYREFPAPRSLARVVTCLWESASDAGLDQRVVPDGCVDLIWLAGEELVIAGADTGPRVVRLPGRRRSFGLRLRPAAAGAVLGVPASEVRDLQPAAALVLGPGAGRTAERLKSASPADVTVLLAALVAERGGAPDTLVDAAAGCLARPGARVAAVAVELGTSERQLHRRTVAAVGYGPKMLARVARLRGLIASPDRSLAARAFAAGYASQSHMTDEVLALTGLTPVRFLEDAVLTAA